ncbi:MAG: DinB family protein [Planctomycetes bacterium]|nr:DinB family protein [Planctomycetota bacterium]
MGEDLLRRLIEHHEWANRGLLRFCESLDAAVLDREPTIGDWTIRKVLEHLVECERGYLSILTVPPGDRREPRFAVGALEEQARSSGQELLALVVSEAFPWGRHVRSTDGYVIEPWVVLLQALNHGADHRRQVAMLLRAQGIDPPRVDGWSYGEAQGALLPPSG